MIGEVVCLPWAAIPEDHYNIFKSIQKEVDF